ncbi:hypothetical protein ACU4GD_44995 [Cupriavidus basilensis]
MIGTTQAALRAQWRSAPPATGQDGHHDAADQDAPRVLVPIADSVTSAMRQSIRSRSAAEMNSA